MGHPTSRIRGGLTLDGSRFRRAPHVARHPRAHLGAFHTGMTISHSLIALHSEGCWRRRRASASGRPVGPAAVGPAAVGPAAVGPAAVGPRAGRAADR